MLRRPASALPTVVRTVVGAVVARAVVGALAVGAVVVAPACSSIQSEDIDTDAITADITLHPRADGSATDVTATLSAGALTFVDLTGDDTLVAKSGEHEVTLGKNQALGALSYEGTLDGTGAAGDEVTVAFERTAFASAPSSTVTLPAPVSITVPAASASFSRADADIVVTLAEDGSTDPVQLSWSGDCVVGGTLDVPAGQTTATIAHGTIARAEPSSADANATPVADTCTLHLSVVRSVDGILDDAFEGGHITARTEDTRDVTTTP